MSGRYGSTDGDLNLHFLQDFVGSRRRISAVDVLPHPLSTQPTLEPDLVASSLATDSFEPPSIGSSMRNQTTTLAAESKTPRRARACLFCQRRKIRCEPLKLGLDMIDNGSCEACKQRHLECSLIESPKLTTTSSPTASIATRSAFSPWSMVNMVSGERVPPTSRVTNDFSESSTIQPWMTMFSTNNFEDNSDFVEVTSAGSQPAHSSLGATDSDAIDKSTKDRASTSISKSLTISQTTTGKAFLDVPLSISAEGYNEILRSAHSSYVDHSNFVDPFSTAWKSFLSRLILRHSAVIACYAATEVFVVDGHIYTFLVVLNEICDSKPNFDSTRSVFKDFRRAMILGAGIDTVTQDAWSVNWVQYQCSAGSVSDTRMKDALWTFGALPPMSHAPEESTSFRWLKQTRRTLTTRQGMVNVLSVSSGEESIPLPKSHELRGQLTHPANSTIRSALLLSIDEEYMQSIQNDCEEWLIVMYNQLMGKPYLEQGLDANIHYMAGTLELEVEAFSKAGYTVCPHGDCPHATVTFEQRIPLLRSLCSELRNTVISGAQMNQPPNPTIRWIAREIGKIHHIFRHAYGLLLKDEYDKYHAVTFPGLTSLRSQLTATPGGVIWNYLPRELKAQACMYRIQYPLA